MTASNASMEVPGVGGRAEEDLDDDVSLSADDDDDAHNRDVLNRRFSFLEKADDEKKRGASLLIFVSLCFEVRKVGAATKSVDAIGKVKLCKTRVTKVKMRKQRTRSSGVPSKSCPMVLTTYKIFYKALLNYYY